MTQGRRMQVAVEGHFMIEVAGNTEQLPLGLEIHNRKAPCYLKWTA